jgi:hypothetical protein
MTPRKMNAIGTPSASTAGLSSAAADSFRSERMRPETLLPSRETGRLIGRPESAGADQARNPLGAVKETAGSAVFSSGPRSCRIGSPLFIIDWESFKPPKMSAMNRCKNSFLPLRSLCLVVGFALLAGYAPAVFGQANAVKPPVYLVPRTHAGPYETLARLTMEAFRAGDIKSAATHAALLELMWDREEINFRAVSPKKGHKIGKSLDDFAEPISMIFIKGYPVPELAKVEAAYATLLEDLKILDDGYHH